MRVPSVASPVSISRADVKASVDVGSQVSESVSTVHVPSLTDDAVPYAGATPTPTDTVDMRVPSVTSPVSISRVDVESSVDMSPAPTVAAFHVIAMNSCSAVKSSPNDTVGPCVSTVSSISPTNVESCVGISPAPTTVVETLDSSLSSTTFDLDQESVSDDGHICLDSSIGGIGFVHRVQNQPPASWPMIPQSCAISKSMSPRFSAVPTPATANALETLD